MVNIDTEPIYNYVSLGSNHRSTRFHRRAIFKAGGNPYGTSVSQGQDGNMIEDVKDAVFHQTKRTLEVVFILHQGFI